MRTLNNYNNYKVCAIIAAAGKSSRMGFDDSGQSKQFIEIETNQNNNKKTVIEKTLTVFELCGYINEIIIASRPEDTEKIREIINKNKFKKVKNIIPGGETRLESVAKAVEKVGEDIDFIAVHDGARCFISEQDIEKVLLKAFETGAATAGTKITDTIKFADSRNNITGTADRNLLYSVQTPQIFGKNLYINALNKCIEDNISNITDDCAIVENSGHIVNIVETSRYNIKITDRQDLEFLNQDKYIKYRTGHGYDVHRLSENRKLILGGIEIPNNNIGLIGHSDADVLIHAVIDSLLGAAGLGDIGEFFPDNLDKYKNISSEVLLKQISELIQKDYNYTISNIDCTVVLQEPKLSDYKAAIRRNLSGVLKIPESDINIKAKTEERLGFTGNKTGIAAHSVCLLAKI
ncbi:MAG: 2-C-methyl-D-erythritol 2,4-cyclodiphosphate synthase [Oscillospiraceae bacterium]|nr:2-C-methyl-D-erythritol 2,4-cyclodiphosphate synthase [Oscillospiraceae bacterium]